ncbi:LCP family protein [Streptosporangium sp. NPDC006930]|uniref:LCP family protein n=1 Tax=unclassified Streptosporangium TaxID=2632669 RepID=UPI0034238047
MDDLKMLRDLGAELEHRPPATLARRRDRLLIARSRRRLRVGWPTMGLAAAAAAAAATVVAVTVPTLVLNGGGSIAPAGVRPVKVTGALNILVVGTDSQAGTPRFRTGGARSDTILLAHLPANRERITFVNLPRDSIVQIPACGAVPGRRDMINSAFNKGGLACTVKTVETLTNVRIDHAMEFDFQAFREVVDALGGVEVRLPRPVNDSKAKLTLPAGKSMLNGEQALAYVRLRNYGDGSDIQRIKRQAALMRAMLKKAGQGITGPARLQSFLSAASRSVKSDMDLGTMAVIAESARESQATFLVVPWLPAPDQPGRIVWKQPEANEFFGDLR